MANPVRGVLRNLRIKRVALVDMGANFDRLTGDGAHIMLAKIHKDSPTIGTVHVDSTDWGADDYESEYEKANLNADTRNGLPDSAFAAVWTDAQGKKHRKLPIHDAGHLTAARGRIDGAKIPENIKAEARRKIEAATTHSKEKGVKKNMFQRLLDAVREPDVEKRTALTAAIEKDFPDDLKDKDDDKEEKDKKEKEEKMHKPDAMDTCKCADCVTKRATIDAAVPEAIAKRLSIIEKANSDLLKNNADLQKSLSTEIAKRERGEVVDLLKSFKATPFVMEGADNDVDKYMAMKKATPEAYESTMRMLKSLDEQAAQSALFSHTGSGRRGMGKGGAWEKMVAKAKELQGIEKTADGKRLSNEQALDKLFESNDPDVLKLVKQYREEAQ